MDLQNFITQTLVQIAKGVEGASLELKDSSAIVNPRNVSGTHNANSNVYGYLDENKKFYRAVQQIEFDVAVVASKGTETKGGIGIMVGSIGLGSQGKSDAENSSHSRIKFKIPMVLPFDKTDKA
jgi:hypothetical protein